MTVLRSGGRGGAEGMGKARNGVVDLTLVPKTWSGRGLLGVHLLPP